MTRELAVLVSCLLVLIFWVEMAFPADTTINYKGMPAPSAISPSVSAYGNDMCRVGVSAAYSGGIFSTSGGTAIVDSNCEAIKLSRQLDSIGLKVAAVAILCADIRVWNAMEMSGSYCPFGSSIGQAARHAWFERYPERFYDLYGKDFVLPTITYPLSDN